MSYKKQVLNTLKKNIDKVTNELITAPYTEQSSWDVQAEELKLYKNEEETPFCDKLAKERGISRDELFTKIENAINRYKITFGVVVGIYQKMEHDVLESDENELLELSITPIYREYNALKEYIMQKINESL